MKMVFYKDKVETGFVNIELFDTATAKAFAEAVGKTTCETNSVNDSINRSKVEIINDFLRLCYLVRSWNDTSYDIKIDVDLSQNFSNQTLFDLHEYFEQLGHRKRIKDPSLLQTAYEEVINIGCEMNGLIHKLESSLNTGQWLQGLFKKEDIARIPLTEEIIKDATVGYKENIIYVGYGETGKNMGHIYQGNEVELLQRKMVQPQRYILSEFFLPFDDKPFNYDAYKKWCIANNAQDKGYDFENPIWYGTWPVGRIIKKSFDSLATFPYYDTIRLEL